MADGKGCKCAARCEAECGCRDVDWTRQDLIDARAEIARLRAERNHWMATAMAFDDHLATMRVMMMEHPTVRFGGADSH